MRKHSTTRHPFRLSGDTPDKRGARIEQAWSFCYSIDSHQDIKLAITVDIHDIECHETMTGDIQLRGIDIRFIPDEFNDLYILTTDKRNEIRGSSVAEFRGRVGGRIIAILPVLPERIAKSINNKQC